MKKIYDANDVNKNKILNDKEREELPVTLYNQYK